MYFEVKPSKGQNVQNGPGKPIHGERNGPGTEEAENLDARRFQTFHEGKGTDSPNLT